jgi:hypothetical protein
LVALKAWACLAALEADEHAADSRAWLEQPRLRYERGQEQLFLDQLIARARPGGHARILAAWTLSSQRRAR